jgi:hypothetical protein
MPGMAMILIGFVAGLFTMTIIGFYKWFLEIWNGGLN